MRLILLLFLLVFVFILFLVLVRRAELAAHKGTDVLVQVLKIEEAAESFTFLTFLFGFLLWFPFR